MWLPLLTSIGVGAATYYTISKNNHSIGQTVQKVLPFVSEMSTGRNSDSGNLGPHGMS